MSDDFVVDLMRQKYKDATDAQVAEAAEDARATAMADGGGIAGLMVINKKSAESIIDRAMTKTMAKAKSKGLTDISATELEWITDVKNTFTKRALEGGVNANPAARRGIFHKKYGADKFNEAMKLTGATADVRVAGSNPWRGNKAVKRALKAQQLEPTGFNLEMHGSDKVAQVKPPKVVLTPGPFNLTKLGQLYKSDPAAARQVALRAGIKL